MTGVFVFLGFYVHKTILQVADPASWSFWAVGIQSLPNHIGIKPHNEAHNICGLELSKHQLRCLVLLRCYKTGSLYWVA